MRHLATDYLPGAPTVTLMQMPYSTGDYFQMTASSLFETERFLARRLSASDAAEMVAIFGDQESMRFVGDTKTLTEADCRYWVVDVTDKNFDSRGYGMIGVVDRRTSTLVACAGVFHPGQQPEPEVMYWIRREFWGKGYGTEIVKGLVAHAKNVWNVGRMIATIHPDNLASQKVIAKAGFVHLLDRDNEDGSTTQVWGLGSSTL